MYWLPRSLLIRIRLNSDAGSQYTSIRLTDHLALEEILPSIGSVGDAYDNALMEAINGLCKAECIRTPVFHEGSYRTIIDVEIATAGWVDWYNNRRLHSSRGNVPPVEFEQAHYATLNREPHPAQERQKTGDASQRQPMGAERRIAAIRTVR